MKRYLLFSGYGYYPGGGWSDFKGDFDTLKEAEDHYVIVKERDREDWYHVVDTHLTRNELINLANNIEFCSV